MNRPHSTTINKEKLMKKEADIIKRCCLFLLHDMANSDKFNKLEAAYKDALVKASEAFPISGVRNYSSVRNKLSRLMRGEPLYHQLVVIKTLADSYNLDDISSGIEKMLFPQVSKTEYESLDSLIRDFKFIAVGKV